MPSPLEIWVWGSAMLMVVCCVLALWRGGPVERCGAAIIFTGWSLSLLLQSKAGEGPGVWVMLIDVAGLAAFLILSAWSRRIWTLFAAACQLDAVISHFAAELTNFGLYSYITAIGMWGGHFLLVALMCGIVGHHLRTRRQARAKARKAI